MKKLLVGILLSLVTVIAFALPNPRQIEDALAAGRYNDAQSMVAQVLNERPDSARAHLLNAYLLIHVQHDKTAANAELNTASGLDRNGDVKNSPLFGRVVGEIDTYKAAAPPTRQRTYEQTPVVSKAAVSPVASPVVQSEPEKSGGYGFVIFVVLLVAVCIGVIAYLFIRGVDERRKLESSYTPYTTSGSRQLTRTRSGGTYNAPYNPPPVPLDPYPGAMSVQHFPAPVQVVQQAPQQSFGSQVAATATGVVAGELIHDALTSSKHHSRTWEEPVREREVVRDPDQGSSRSSSSRDESPVSYSNERSSFSSGSDDSWSSRSSDSSSSSSWDSGSSSSSSSWDSGSSSSWDSGSSSSSSDW
jgi:hypothetical protein